ncbi:MAG TPA: hypothetical protein VEA92_03150 [Candidatus Paceibacterota bacterium]|nr:hypothetical protein [Candidatus Paceibacterota bacterium]
MPFFQALGLGVAIIVLKLLTPVLFSEIEATAILFLRGAQTSATAATELAASVGQVRVDNESPLVLPRAPQIRE